MIAFRFNDNFNPADTKDATPIYRINYCDTPWTVKSEGIELKRYLLSGEENPDFTNLSNLELVDTLTVPNVGFYSDSGSMLGFHESDNFALHYTGYFWTNHIFNNIDYSFKMFGYGYTRVYIDNQQWLIGNDTTWEVLDDKISLDTSLSMSPQRWYKIDIYYYTRLGQAGFSFLWDNENQNEFIPVSAGVLSKNQTFKDTVQVRHILGVDRSETQGEVSTLNFKLPLVASGSSNDGYYYNIYWKKYCHTNYDISLDKYKLIEFEAGYLNDSNEDYLKKFVGHIESFNSVRGSTENVLEVSCVGFENLFKQSLNLNYPNTLDYWNSGYAGLGVTYLTPDGIGMPPTYDGWALPQAFKSLCFRSNIDPTLFVTKRTFLNSQDIIVSGTEYIEETSPNSVILDTNLNYGNSVVVNQDIGSIADDEYILKSNFGESLFDYMNTISDVYGWRWGINSYADGSPYLRSNNNPQFVYNVNAGLGTDGYGTDQSGNDWTTVQNLGAIQGEYAKTNDYMDYTDFYFKGAKADLVIVGGNESGNETAIESFNSTLDEVVVTGTTGFSTNNRVVIETIAGEESKTIQSISSNTWTLDSALSYAPRVQGYAKTATFSAELRQGTTWASAAPIQTSYHSCRFSNTFDKFISNVGVTSSTPSVLDSKRYFYDGIDPSTSLNPTKLNLVSSQPYDDYILRVMRLSDTDVGTTNYLNIDSLLVYDRDTDQVAQTFYTGDSIVSGTVSTLRVEDSGLDLRNDTIVVGRRLGADVPGAETDRPINPNNPTFNHIISRATDIESIYNPDAENYVGMARQTVQISPEIASYDRANYWSSAFINRYRNPAKFPELTTLGNPLMEIGDCIAVYDEGLSTLESFNRFWITDINESYQDKEYTTTYLTTAYKPWESYTPKLNVDTTNYGDKIIQNLSIENGGDGDADSLLSNLTSAFDPYASDSKGTKVIIRYDLVADAHVRIDIFPSERPYLKVATLLNPTGQDGPEGWQKQEVGKDYVVTWDGVDMYGEWNSYATEDSTRKIGQGYYVHEGKNPTNLKGKFFIKITLLKRNSTTPLVIFSDSSDYLGTNGYIYTRRANETSIHVGSTPYCYMKINGVSRVPNVAFTDSVDFNGKMAVKFKIFDTTSPNFPFYTTRTMTLGVDNATNYPGLGLPNYNERNLYNRKIQLKIKGHNMIYIFGHSSKYNSVQKVPIFADIYYDNQSFNYYNMSKVFERYVNPALFGYSYNYESFVSETWVNNIKNDGGQIYMAWYIYIEVEAYDKSGRRVIVTAPNPDKNESDFIVADGFWVYWLDDRSPYLSKNSTFGPSNASGYPWSWVRYDDSNVNAVFPDKNGINIISDTERGTGDILYLVQVYPKTWGY